MHLDPSRHGMIAFINLYFMISRGWPFLIQKNGNKTQKIDKKVLYFAFQRRASVENQVAGLKKRRQI